MKNLSFIEIILVLSASNIISFVFGFFLRKLKMEALSKEITRLEIELMNSHSEVLKEMQENVRLENTIKNLITSKHKVSQQLHN
jgi:hypothetical protein